MIIIIISVWSGLARCSRVLYACPLVVFFAGFSSRFLFFVIATVSFHSSDWFYALGSSFWQAFISHAFAAFPLANHMVGVVCLLWTFDHVTSR